MPSKHSDWVLLGCGKLQYNQVQEANNASDTPCTPCPMHAWTLTVRHGAAQLTKG